MTAKREFDAEEWTVLQQAPALAALRVSAASRGGRLAESVSLARAYAEAREKGEGLTAEIVAAPPAVDGKELQDPEALRERSSRALREAVALLRQKATAEELEDYRLFVSWLAEQVARAHKEGGVLGIGGKEISEDEQAELDAIAAALRA